MNRQGKQLVAPSQPRNKRSYFTWNAQMDAILTSTLFEQIGEGNKGDGDFKSQAYQAVVDKLRNNLKISVTVDHVKNRIKVWKKHYAVITEIRTSTKFRWDEEKKMLVVPIEDLGEWQTYCQETNLNASAYLNKSIENWDDICNLFGADRANGDGAEQHDESAAAMEAEMRFQEGDRTSEATSGGSNKRLKRDRLADAVMSFAETFQKYMDKEKDLPSEEIYKVVSEVQGIARHEVLRAIKWFVDRPKDFEMLKILPENEKLDYILLCIKE